jgi:putative transposase
MEYLRAENQSLREQLGNRRILAALGPVVTPDTLLRWYRNLVAANYDGSMKRGVGRPRMKPDIRKLVMRMARENPSWGYTRIRGALFNLGHDIARNTIKAILKERGIEPAPERGRHANWHTFIKSHLGAIAGADFFTVEVIRGFGLVRYHVFCAPRRRGKEAIMAN